MAGGNNGENPIDQVAIDKAIADANEVLDKVGLELIGTRPKTRG